MLIRFASNQEVDIWDKLILSNPDGGNVTQSIELARLKSQIGWKSRFVFADDIAITVQERYILGLGKLWYMPKGPGINDVVKLVSVIKFLRKFAKEHGVFVIKIEPEIIKNKANILSLTKLGAIKASNIQPNSSTVILKILKDTEQMMNNLPQKSRHAIKRAYRDGVVTKIVEPSEKNLDIMFDLMTQTMAKKSVMMRDSSYYKNFWKSYINNGMSGLFFAYFNNKPVAGAFVNLFGKKATYKDGGSVRNKSVYGASHALQWCIIEWLSKKRVVSYDLCGSPSSADIDNKKHPLYGVGLFKTSFNKNVSDFVGVYDIPVKRFKYKVWSKFGEYFVGQFYHKILKSLFY